MECLLAEGQKPQAPVILPNKRSHACLPEDSFENLPGVQIVLEVMCLRIPQGCLVILVQLQCVDGREFTYVFPKAVEVILHHSQRLHPHNVGEIHLVPQTPGEIH